MKTKEQIAKEIISLYKTKAQLKRMKETINAFNANSVVVACLQKMKTTAKKEENLPERWNLVKVGRE